MDEGWELAERRRIETWNRVYLSVVLIAAVICIASLVAWVVAFSAIG
jgi:hypothetical protein